MPSKVDCIIPFGKYKGEYVSDIYESDTNYLKWMLENWDVSEELRKALEYHLS